MMYTTYPLVDQYWDSHYGFYGICCLLTFVIINILLMWKEDGMGNLPTTFWLTVVASLFCLAHYNSYQPEKKYTNTKVIGTFVKIEAEGFSQRSGKTKADYHYLYVVYEIEGQYSIFQTTVGSTWPKSAVFYRNEKE